MTSNQFPFGPILDLAARWEQIARLLPAERTAGRPYRQHCQILEGMLWVMATGTSWRQLPLAYAPWSIVIYGNGPL